MKETQIIVIDGGTARFFAAITCARFNYNAEVIILEKAVQLFSKVKISEQSRCNVTHTRLDNNQFSKNYSSEDKELKNYFVYFSTHQTIDWFESQLVHLKKEPYGRISPISDSSRTVTSCLIRVIHVLDVKIMTNFNVIAIQPPKNKWIATIKTGEHKECGKIRVATSGNSTEHAYLCTKKLGITIVPPVPPLFTFNIPNSRLNVLQGITIPLSNVRIQGTQHKQYTPILITHSNFSGTAIIKLSSWAADYIYQTNYDFNIHINWLNNTKKALRQSINLIKAEHPKKDTLSNLCFKVPLRLWKTLTSITIKEDTQWCDLNQKNANRFTEELIQGIYTIKEKNIFKDEFVTASGVSLKEITFLLWNHTLSLVFTTSVKYLRCHHRQIQPSSCIEQRILNR